MAAIIWFGGNNIVDSPPDDATILRGYDEAANLLYSIRYEGPKYAKWPRFVLADPVGHLYVAWHNNTIANPPPTEYFRKYRQNGDRIPFPELHGSEITAMAIAGDGSIYVAGGGVGAEKYWLRKYNAAGVLQWSKSPRDIPTTGAYSASWIRLDSSENVIFAGATVASGSELTKYQPDGTFVWSVVTNGVIHSVAIDGSDNVYTGSSQSTGYFFDGDYDLENPSNPGANLNYFPEGTTLIQKWNSSGAYQSGYLPAGGRDVYQVEFASSKLHCYLYLDNGLKYYVTLNADFTWQTTQSTYNADSTLNFDDTLIQRHWIAVDSGGNAYLAMSRNKTTPWATAAYKSTSVFVVENVEMPSLELPYSLAVPTWQGDLYASVPALALRYALKAPETIRDYVGGLFLPSVYRLYLTGDTGTIELPLSSISCRRGYGSMSLSVVCPGLTQTQIEQIDARLADQGELVVYRGIRFAEYEQSDEMLRCPLQSLRWDAGANSASITLSGQTAEIANAKTRAISGISYRNLNAGLRRVRCAVDTYLRPGDIVDLGAGETMVVAEITYAISSEIAPMEISE